MSDKAVYSERIVKVMNSMRWKILSQNEDEITFISGFLYGAWRDRITVRLTDKVLYIEGPRGYIEEAIRRSKLPYRAFEISSVDEIT
jgi:hypothetical protein